MMFNRRQASMLVGAVLAATLSTTFAQAPAAPAAPVRIRGAIEKIEPGSITVRDRSGEVVTLAVPASTTIAEVLPMQLADIQAGSFIGSGAMPQPDGTLRAIQVVVFPEAMRGTGEGHRNWDAVPQSTMTNATVDQVVVASGPAGRTLKLKYKDGEKTLVVPPDVPVVTLKPADASLLVVGAKLSVTAVMKDGTPTATRITAGRNGFAPPM
ncbi:hypothetical protein [Variovorax sp. HJSM1_2]|uniref:hypothetical protein n=1 Tax=Variovorax sp. HJSM1_2 TaxID=3366263 RepID=UPI003BE3DC02